MMIRVAVPEKIVMNAARALAAEERKFENWPNSFAQSYGAHFVSAMPFGQYCFDFNSEQDYVMFLLKWS